MPGTAFKINRYPTADMTENPLREEISADATTGRMSGKIIFPPLAGWRLSTDRRLAWTRTRRRNESSFRGRSQIPERDHKMATSYPLPGEGEALEVAPSMAPRGQLSCR